MHTIHHRDQIEKMIRVAKNAQFVYGHIDWRTHSKIDIRKDDFLFTFLRDPVDRLLSSYRFYCSPQGWQYSGLDGSPDDYSFIDYLGAGDFNAQWAVGNLMVRQFSDSFTNRFCNDAEWLEALKLAQHNISKLSFIGFQKKFNADFPTLCTMLNAKPFDGAPENVSINQNSFELSSAEQALVKDKTRWDQSLFDGIVS